MLGCLYREPRNHTKPNDPRTSASGPPREFPPPGLIGADAADDDDPRAPRVEEDHLDAVPHARVQVRDGLVVLPRPLAARGAGRAARGSRVSIVVLPRPLAARGAGRPARGSRVSRAIRARLSRMVILNIYAPRLVNRSSQSAPNRERS